MVNMSNGLARPTGLMTPERPPVQEAAAPQQGNPETMQALLQLLAMILSGGMGGQGMGQPPMGQAPMGQPAPAPMPAPMMGGMGGP